MSQQRDEEMLMRNYLLGDLDERGQKQVEEHLFRDEGFADRLSAAQDSLIDDYVFDTLSARERESFEKNFRLTDERRKKLLFAQTLEIYVDDHYGEQPSPLDVSHRPSPSLRNPLLFLQAHKGWSVFSLAMILLLIFITPQVFRWLRPPDQGALAREQRARIERRLSELNKRPADQRNQALPAYELPLQPTLLREDSGIKRVVLTGDIQLLTLKLSLPQAQHENYRALVSTAEGNELFAIDGLTSELDAGVATVILKIPSEFLSTADYQIQLRGATGGGNAENAVRYNFRVINKK